MRVCIHKPTGKLLEAQSNDDASLDVLLANAVAAGYAASDLDLKVVTDAEFTELLNPPPSLDEAKTSAKASIDAQAETLRQSVLTPGSGQAAEYCLTHAEAVNYLTAVAAGNTPNPASYPFLLAEQAALAPTTGEVGLADVATAIMADVTTCKATLAAIKQARRTGKLAVDAATNEDAVTAAMATVVWP
jgi:hypothetical protein